MAFADHVPFYNPDPYKKLVAGMNSVLGDGDAIALLPYDDGTFFLKRAYFDKQLIGGIGGYETDDGDKIAVDGTGEAVRELFGVPMLLGCDPTEHAAAVDPIKALTAHKDDIGEWIRVDRAGEVVQVGPALRPAAAFEAAESASEAMAAMTDDELLSLYLDDYAPREHTAAEKRELVDSHYDDIQATVEAAYTADEHADIDEQGVVGDGGMVGDAVIQSQQEPSRPTMSFQEALTELSESGDVCKIYDIAPPGGAYLDQDGEVRVEEATHIAVDQSKAADLLPTTWDTVEINTALDRARMEEYEEGRLMKYLTYGILIGGVGAVLVASFIFLLMTFTGGVT